MADDAPKRRRGRPAIRDGEASVPFHLRMSVTDYDKACLLARKHGVSVPHILRTAFRLAVKRQQRLDEP